MTRCFIWIPVVKYTYLKRVIYITLQDVIDGDCVMIFLKLFDIFNFPEHKSHHSDIRFYGKGEGEIAATYQRFGRGKCTVVRNKNASRITSIRQLTVHFVLTFAFKPAES